MSQSMPRKRNLEWEYGVQLLENQRNHPHKTIPGVSASHKGWAGLCPEKAIPLHTESSSRTCLQSCSFGSVSVPCKLASFLCKTLPSFFFFHKIVCKCVQKEIAAEIKIKQLNVENMENSYGNHLQDLV